jgi:prolyl-tRNA synthetase
MLRPVARGIYDVLPLGLRVQRKIERIVREEIERGGAHEVVLPVVQPAELWESSGRWATYTREGLLATLQDRAGRDFCLGPTAEEVITDLVKRDVRSYRDLPVSLYQIQTKFRDEIRPRFGLLRAREFVMMDAYSFDRNVEQAAAAYWRMYAAYERIFQRCGLACRPVEALTGAMGGNMSHEFQVFAAGGENEIALCGACHYAANVEKAAIGVGAAAPPGAGDCPPAEPVSTPGQHTVDAVSAFLGVPPTRIVKTLLYQSDVGPLGVLVRGDHTLNDDKLRAALGAAWVEMADEITVQRLTRAPIGFAGPIGLGRDVRLIADRSLRGARDVVVGGNAADLHLVHVALERDAGVGEFLDVRNAVAGDACPRCTNGTLGIEYGIEVGQVYALGTRYSVPMQANFRDESGQSRPFEMGCYGIGIGRTMAAAVEQHHDALGIVWPAAIAPYTVALLALDASSLLIAERLYDELLQQGVDVLFDDRDERAGVKFKDADLLGLPYQLIVGRRALQEGQVELKRRHDGVVERIAVEAVGAKVSTIAAC